MARPQRNSVDYFPFYCEEGKKMYYLEETYGNDGFATFVKLLRELAKTDYHYLDLSKNTTMMFLSAKCKVSLETLNLIIKDLVDLEKFDRVLWEENSIIWCQDFIDSIEDAYIKRKNKCITYDGLLMHLNSLGVRKLSKSKSKGAENTQSKEEYSKEDKIKEDVLYSIYDLKIFYLSDEKLVNAVIGNKDNKFKGKEHLIKQLDKFNRHLTENGSHAKKWSDYTSHFRNWNKRNVVSRNDDSPTANIVL